MMKPETAIALWNEADRVTLGGDNEGNEYSQRTVFGGFILAREIGTVSFWEAKHMPDNLKKAATFLREWADGIEEAIQAKGA